MRPGFLVKEPAPQKKRLLALRLKAEGRGSVSLLRQGLLGAGAVSHPKRMTLKVEPNLLFLDLEQMPRTRNSTTSRNVYEVALFSSLTAVLTTDTHGRAVPSAARSQIAPVPQLAPVGRLSVLPLIESVGRCAWRTAAGATADGSPSAACPSGRGTPQSRSGCPCSSLPPGTTP